jgi:hypothetical protein
LVALYTSISSIKQEEINLRACLGFIFGSESGSGKVLGKRFFSRVAALWSEKKANAGSWPGRLQRKTQIPNKL